jgi:hypothetical protein
VKDKKDKEHRKRFKKEEDMFLKGETKMNLDGEEGFTFGCSRCSLL